MVPHYPPGNHFQLTIPRGAGEPHCHRTRALDCTENWCKQLKFTQWQVEEGMHYKKSVHAFHWLSMCHDLVPYSFSVNILGPGPL